MCLACSPRVVLVLLHTPHLSSSLAPCSRPWRRCAPNPNLGTDCDRGNDAVLALSSLLKSAQAHQLIVHLQPLTHSTSHTQLQDSAVLHSACNRHPNLNLNLIPISISSDAHHTSSDKRPQCLLTLITLAYHIYVISHALAHSSRAPCAARAPRPRNISNFREIWLLSRSGPLAGHGARVRGYGRTR